MSKISTLYDDFITRVTTVLPQHLRLSDAYLLVKNTESEKRKGFGVRIGPGNHTGQSLSCDIILQQTITLILTRIVQAHETQGATKATTEKQLMEDLFLVIDDVESDPTLGDSNTVISGAYVSHGGIEFVAGERDSWMRVEAEFSFRYRHDLN